MTRNKKEKHNKVLMLARSKLSSVEIIISQALIDLEISHKESKTIVNEKEKYEKMKNNISIKENREKHRTEKKYV